MSAGNPVGFSKSQGWEIGVSRTFATTPERAWEALMTQPGLGYWLGQGVGPSFKKGDAYTTQEGTTGFIRSYTEGSLIRLRWQPPHWDFTSTLQIRVNPAKTGATISIHHEKLQNGGQRDVMRAHWTEVLEKIGSLIERI
jgi:uncharacterized protein YndB with AHSA1/START domain